MRFLPRVAMLRGAWRVFESAFAQHREALLHEVIREIAVAAERTDLEASGDLRSRRAAGRVHVDEGPDGVSRRAS
jgi:hypothetical protein